MGRLYLIGMMAILGIAFVFLTFFLYSAYKKIMVNGKSLLEEPVNESTNTDKMGFGEILLYTLMFLIAAIFALQILYKGSTFPSATAVLLRVILLVPIMALFNARKRTGKAIVALFASGFFLIFCTIAYLAIGLPVKAPVLMIDQTELRPGETTVKELIDGGLEIYLKKEDATKSDLREFPNSDRFEKFTGDPSVTLRKGYHFYGARAIPHAEGILVKDDCILAELVFFGSLTEDIPLKDCSIIRFNTSESFLLNAGKTGTSLSLDGVDLLSGMDAKKIKKTFGRKLLRANKAQEEKLYIISWDTSSNHLFYNTYGAKIELNEEDSVSDLELSCRIAREADE